MTESKSNTKITDTIKEFIRYCLVGGIAFLVDFGVLIFFTEVLNLDYKISAIFGFIAGLAVNYILSKTFVFKKKVNSETKAFTIFAIIGIIGLGITELGLWLGADIVGIDYRIAKIIVTGVVLFWNYLGRKFLIFNREI